jgi:hypothetical protein
VAPAAEDAPFGTPVAPAAEDAPFGTPVAPAAEDAARADDNHSLCYFTHWLVHALAGALAVLVAGALLGVSCPVTAVFFVVGAFLLGTFGAHVVSFHMHIPPDDHRRVVEGHFVAHALPMLVALVIVVFWRVFADGATVHDALTAWLVISVFFCIYLITPLHDGTCGMKKVEAVYGMPQALGYCTSAATMCALVAVAMVLR